MGLNVSFQQGEIPGYISLSSSHHYVTVATKLWFEIFINNDVFRKKYNREIGKNHKMSMAALK